MGLHVLINAFYSNPLQYIRNINFKGSTTNYVSLEMYSTTSKRNIEVNSYTILLSLAIALGKCYFRFLRRLLPSAVFFRRTRNQYPSRQLIS